MPSLSLTDLVDVVSKAGTPKATKVAAIKNRKGYSPATDFYKPMRDGIIEIHQKGWDKKALGDLQKSLMDPKKMTNYPGAIDGYRRWWGKKNINWFNPPRNTYGHAGIDVAINPELGLEIDGKRHIVKLYLKAEPLTKLRVNLITVLMEVSLRSVCKDDDLLAILDVRQAKLFTVDTSIKPIKAVVDAELAYIAALWPSV